MTHIVDKDQHGHPPTRLCYKTQIPTNGDSTSKRNFGQNVKETTQAHGALVLVCKKRTGSFDSAQYIHIYMAVDSYSSGHIKSYDFCKDCRNATVMIYTGDMRAISLGTSTNLTYTQAYLGYPLKKSI